MTNLPPVQFSIVAGGIDQVQEAFRSVADMADKFAQDVSKSLSSIGKAAKSSGKKATTEVERAGQEQAKAVAKSAKTQISEASKLANRMARIKEASATLAGRIAVQQANAEERAAKQTSKALEREAGKQAKATAKAAKAKALASEGFRNKLGGAFGGAVSSALGTAGKVVGAIGALGGGFTIADAVSGQLSAEKAAANFSVASGNTVSTKDALAKANMISKDHGIESKDILEGMQSYVAKTGDAKGAFDNADFLAKVAKSQGVDMKEVSGVMGSLKTQNEGLSSDQLQKMVLMAVGQGKKGSVELKDMAGALSKVTAGATQYAGDQGTNQMKLAGLTQIAIKGTGDANSAATSVSDLSRDIAKHGSKMKALGIDTTDKNGKITDINEILAKSVAKAGGSGIKLRSMGYGEESMKVMNVLSGVFEEEKKKTMESTKGSKSDKEKAGAKAGEEAVRKYIDEMQKASITMEQLDQDYKTVSDTTGDKLDKAFNNLKIVAGEKLVPELSKLVPKIAELLPNMVKLIDAFIGAAKYIEDNPLKSAFLAMAGLVSGNLAKAFAPQIMQGIMKMAFASPGIAAAIGAALAIAMVAAEEKRKIDAFAKKKKEEGENNSTKVADKLKEVRAELEGSKGPLTAERKEALEKQKVMLEKAQKTQLEDALATNKEAADSGSGGTTDKLKLGFLDAISPIANFIPGVDVEKGAIGQAKDHYANNIAAVESAQGLIDAEAARMNAEAAEMNKANAEKIAQALASLHTGATNGDPIK
jgi:hypothetical protein